MSHNKDEVVHTEKKTAYYHLPGLFEFVEFYKVFLPLFRTHREWFYDWCEIGSIYGAPMNVLWGGGRVGFGDADPKDVLCLLNEYQVSGCLTFSNSLIQEDHLTDKQCNELCRMFENTGSVENGITIYSDLLLNYIREHYPKFYFVSSTTKVLTDFQDFKKELHRDEFEKVVIDFRLNRELEELRDLSSEEKAKTEFLVNECCDFDCKERKNCYENVSRKALGETCEDHVCASKDAKDGYRFSKAMQNPGFIGLEDIQEIYLPLGFSDFKIEGRSLGSAVLLEFILYYMTKPEYQLRVREEIYLDSMLDLF